MTTTPNHQPNLGPGILAEAGTTGGPNFTLSRPEWIAIQTYVQDCLGLPINDDQLRNSLGSGAPSDMSGFQPLLAAYQALHNSASTWQTSTFPRTVRLASQVYEYGHNKVPPFYRAISTEAAKLVKDPGDTSAKNALKAILTNLKHTATGFANDADSCKRAVTAFVDQTETSQRTLVGPHGNSGLLKDYNDRYGATSEEVTRLSNEIKAQKIILKAANEEYNHDVIVASTTPSYAWLGPLGLIAASVVAGVYGHRAVEALHRAHAAQAEIDRLTAEKAADAKLMTVIKLTVHGVQGIVQEMNAALTVLQKIKGYWGALADDITHIIHIIDNDIAALPPSVMSIGVDEAINAWASVATLANSYRLHAYVHETSGGSAESFDAWKVRAHFSSQNRKAA